VAVRQVVARLQAQALPQSPAERPGFFFDPRNQCDQRQSLAFSLTHLPTYPFTHFIGDGRSIAPEL
jgi:hypothetical protein